MSKLRILKNNDFVQDLHLQSGQTYLAGRADNCQIKLDGEIGISRQHFQLSQVNEKWKLEVLSRYGELYFNGAKSATLELTDGANFEVPPYKFIYTESEHSVTATEDVAEATAIAILPSAAYIRITDERGQAKNVFRLEGEAWTGGRELSCAIHIDNTRVSRRQFEVYREGNLYFVRDLGSANGTLLNGQKLSSQDWTPLQSGDTIAVADWFLKFEIRDSSFQSRMEAATQDVQHSSSVVEWAPPVQNPPEPQGFDDEPNSGTHYGVMPHSPPPPPDSWQDPNSSLALSDFSMGAVGSLPPPVGGGTFPPFPNAAGQGNPQPAVKKKLLNPVRIGILLLLVVGGYFAMNDQSGKSEGSGDGKVVKAKTPFDGLTPADQQVVIRAYDNAKKDLMSQNFLDAIQEITRLKEKVPYYEDSREIEKYANEGLSRKEQLVAEERREKDKIEMDEKIKRQTELCRRNMRADEVDISRIDACLFEVLSLNPDHPAIQALHADVEKIIAERATKKAKQAAYSGEVHKLQEMYNHAHNLMVQERSQDGLEALKRVVDAKLPDPNGLKNKARVERETFLSQRAERQAKLEEQADRLQKDGHFREAIQAYQEALKINPDNEVTKGHFNQAMLELRKLMQAIYQESIVEESVGDVEAAKTKWKKIMEQSVPSETYYDKARTKLKKYGVL